MIEAKEINFAYRRGIPVLFDINCKIEDGEFVALLGHLYLRGLGDFHIVIEMSVLIVGTFN